MPKVKEAIEKNDTEEAHSLLSTILNDEKADIDLCIEAAECYKRLEDFEKMLEVA